MLKGKAPVVLLAYIVIVLSVIAALGSVVLVEQRRDFRMHRHRNELVHAEVVEFVRCALALPPAPIRTQADLDECFERAVKTAQEQVGRAAFLRAQ